MFEAVVVFCDSYYAFIEE